MNILEEKNRESYVKHVKLTTTRFMKYIYSKLKGRYGLAADIFS